MSPGMLTRTLRPYQEDVLRDLDQAFANGRRRAWVVLPPGAGKTLVGLEAARRRGRPVVVFGPNTAIQGQWIKEWSDSFDGDARATASRDLRSHVAVLTYQSLANFDPDVEVDEDGAEVRHTERLRPQGRRLVDAMRSRDRFTLVLDECHHLLDTWGELVAEILAELPNATVIGLTATPPDRLTAAEARLVDELFGAPILGPSIPAVVRSGFLAPYAELAWLTEPTSAESAWIAAEAERFTELTTDLLDPSFASTPFLRWLDERVVARRIDGQSQPGVPWHRFERDHPELAAAALRLHHHGLLDLPTGARVREEHRHPPSAGDWVSLVGDYVRRCLRPSDSVQDEAAVRAIRNALPAVGYSLTRQGIRAGRSPVDRVLARSAAKTHAVTEILAAESAALGDRLRAVVLCDHERATATLPARLSGVLDSEAGSARLVLETLIADPVTARLGPMLVTGRTVATDRQTAERFLAFCAERDPELTLDVATDRSGVAEITGTWSSRRWVPLATAFFDAGEGTVLIGTRGMLGEGWNAQSVNTLVDLTEATTATSVVQIRGRALRLDPNWPDKTAHTWSVVCVAPDHPRGHTDWDRFVRKHDSFFAMTADGQVMAGVAHVDPGLSPFAPPPAEDFGRINADMLLRAERRGDVHEMWDVGSGYTDRLVHTVMIRTGRRAQRPAPTAGADHRVPASLPAPAGLHPGVSASPHVTLVPAAVALIAGFVASASLLFGIALAGVVFGAVHWLRRLAVARRRLRATSGDPDLAAMGCALAEALHATGLVSRAAEAVELTADADGAYRVSLSGVPEAESACFAAAFDELVSPLADPRYVIPRYLVNDRSLRAAARYASGRPGTNDLVYHAVPAVLGENRKRADAFGRAWSRWVSVAEVIYTRNPEGAGILVASAGVSPTDSTTALRTTWA